MDHNLQWHSGCQLQVGGQASVYKEGQITKLNCKPDLTCGYFSLYGRSL